MFGDVLTPTVTDTARRFLGEGSAVLTVLLLAALGVTVVMALPRRRLAAAGAAVSLAVVLGATLTPVGGWRDLHFESGALRSIATNLAPHRTALIGWLVNADGPANVLLYLPAGLFLAWATRRPFTSAVALAALSLGIECWQASLTTRVGSFDDVVANALGAALGAGLAAVPLTLMWVARTRPRPA